jgi:nucleoside-diphosphate-sugar epimerase
MKVLVMGGTRFNGLALVRELVRHGHEVTVLNRGQSAVRLPRPVRRLYADRTNYEQLRQVLRHEEFDVVQDISGYTVDDVRAMVDIFRHRIGHYIFASSTVIYGPAKILPIREDHPVDLSDRQTVYGRHKLRAEALLVEEYRRNGFPATTVPFSMVMGPNNIVADREQRVFKAMLLGRPILVPGDGTTLSQTGYVDDGARALRMLMLQPRAFGKRYNLTGQDHWSDEGYVDTFAEVIGIKPSKVFVPPPLMDDIYSGRYDTGTARAYLPAMASSGDSAAPTMEPPGSRFLTVTGLIQRLGPNLHHWNESTYFSIDRLWEDIGFRPACTFAAAVEKTYDWFRREKLDQTLQFNFDWEDGVLARLGASR